MKLFQPCEKVFNNRSKFKNIEKPDNLEIAKADEFETFSSSIPNYSIAFNFMEG